MRDYLSRLGLIDAAAAEKIANRVRDRDGVSVWRCPRSGIIFLEGEVPELESYYSKKAVDHDPSRSVTELDGNTVASLWQEDDGRRAEQFNDFLRGKVWLDFGAGEGGLVRIMRDKASHAYAYELNLEQCDRMRSQGLDVLDDWRKLDDECLDVLTLFHVFEHLARPVEDLSDLAAKLKPGGVVIIEVPHGRDFLIKHLDCEPFRDFTFWSEHLLLHTRVSLEFMLRRAGFSDVIITGYQRYPLSNHLYWLRHSRPGGHEDWAVLDSAELRSAYAAMLNRIDQTDTIIAVARKPR
jgi:SAM-dependent methyltransferase